MMTDAEVDSDKEDSIVEEGASKGDDRCPICLNKFTEQWTGIPETCQHVFCMDCILEWSKKSCSCPIDRIEFHSILLYDKSALFQRSVPVAPSTIQEGDYLASVYCQICESPDEEETLLLCDGCDLGYHCRCLSPPLHEVPHNEWFCAACQDERGLMSVILPSPSTRRALGRTRAVERVRFEIHEYRSRISYRREIESQIDKVISDILGRPKSWFHELANQQKSKSEKKVQRSSSKARSGGSVKRSKNRIRPGTRNQDSRCTSDLFISSSLSLFGGDEKLDVHLARNMETEPSYLLAQKHRQLSAASIRFNLPLPSLLTSGAEVEVEVTERTSPERISDLLGHIIEQQDILTLPSTCVHIGRNGSVEKKILSVIPSMAHNDHKVYWDRNKINTDSKKHATSATAPSDTNGSTAGSSTFRKKSGRGKTESKQKYSASACLHVASVSGSSEARQRKREGTVAGSSGLSVFQASKNQGMSLDPAINDISPKSAKTARKIKIKRITNLPVKHSKKEVKTDEQESEAYDPFNPTDEEVTGLCQKIETSERNIYDPFQPTVSDDERDGGSAVSMPSDVKSGNRGNVVKEVIDPTPDRKNILKIDRTEISVSGSVINGGGQSEPCNTASAIKSEEIDMFADAEIPTTTEKVVMEKVHIELPSDGQACAKTQVKKRIELKTDSELAKVDGQQNSRICSKQEADLGEDFKTQEKFCNLRDKDKSSSLEYELIHFHGEKRSKIRDSSVTSCKSDKSGNSSSPICKQEEPVNAQRERFTAPEKSKKSSTAEKSTSKGHGKSHVVDEDRKSKRLSSTLSTNRRHSRTSSDDKVNRKIKVKYVNKNQSGSSECRYQESRERKGKRSKRHSSHFQKHRSRSCSTSPLKERGRKYKSGHSRCYDSGEYLSSPETKRKKHQETKPKKSKRYKSARYGGDDYAEMPHDRKNKANRTPPEGLGGVEPGTDKANSKRKRHGKKRRIYYESTKYNTSEEENFDTEKRSKAKKRRHGIGDKRKTRTESPVMHERSLSPIPSCNRSKKKKHKKCEESEPGTTSRHETKVKKYIPREPLLLDHNTVDLKSAKKLNADFETDISLENVKKAKRRKKHKRTSSDTSKKGPKDAVISPNDAHLPSEVEVVQAWSPSDGYLDVSNSPKYVSPKDVDNCLEKTLDNIPAAHSPSPLTPSLSPSSNRNLPISQEIKETLSCAEEFVEQSRRRWKQRRKPPEQSDPPTNNRYSNNGVVADTEKPVLGDNTEPLKLDIFAVSPASKGTCPTSDNALTPAHSLTDTCVVSSTPPISKNVVSVSAAPAKLDNVLGDTYPADTDHRTDTNLEKMDEVNNRNSHGKLSPSRKLGDEFLPAIPHKHEDGIIPVLHPISTISGLPHSNNPEIHDATGLFEDRVFEAFASRFNQNKPSSTLIEVPMNEAEIQNDAGSSKQTLIGYPASSAQGNESLKNPTESSNSGLDKTDKGSKAHPEVSGSEFAKPVTDDTKVMQEIKLSKGSKSGDAVLNPTQILYSIGLNPQQKSAAQNAILSIAELSKHLELDKVVKTVWQDGGKELFLGNSPTDNIESSAVEMYNKGKQQGFVQKIKFQERVAEEAKIAIKPYYERREISKAEYKEIMKRAVNKICSSESSMEVNSVKTRRLIRRYIEKYQQKNAFKKDRMRSKLSNELTKLKRDESPSPPKYQPLSPPSPACELSMKLDEQKFLVGTPRLLKREPRKVVTLPDLPLPPPPPPPPPPMPTYKR